MASSSSGTDAPAADPRSRILDAALALMSEQGSAGASMRQLATACGLNVATIYHYFPSKADLLRSVMHERRYDERLSIEAPNLDQAIPVHDRLVGLILYLWNHALGEEAVWRLLIGEAIRNEAAATSSTREVVDALLSALEVWLAEGFPELAEHHHALARVIRGQIFAMIIEHMALHELTAEYAEKRAAELADVVLGSPAPPAS